MSDQDVFISWDTAETFITTVFETLGSSHEEAAICADVILESDRRGIKSHGINRFKPFYYDRVREGILFVNTNFEIVNRTTSTALVDGHDGMGQYIGYRSMKLAIEIAKETGVGVVVAKNSAHFGIAGYYSNMATKDGCVGIVATNARPSIAPTFGVENMLGTNPLSIGIPTDEVFDFLIDCATSTFQRGQVEFLARSGKELPEGMVIDHDGKSITSAAAIMEGLAKGTVALTALGGAGERTAGYKGYGYATAFELLCSAFTSSNYMKMLLNGRTGRRTRQIPYRSLFHSH